MIPNDYRSRSPLDSAGEIQALDMVMEEAQQVIAFFRLESDHCASYCRVNKKQRFVGDWMSDDERMSRVDSLLQRTLLTETSHFADRG